MKKVSTEFWPKTHKVNILIGSILFVLLVMTVAKFLLQPPVHTAAMIASDIRKLAEIFEKIEKDAGIISFDYQKNPINFLNIKKDGFVGSEIGPMNLAHPEKWNGPYLNDNPTMQAKEYQIVRTEAGYFITPGEGVELPNGKFIGKEIILDEAADIDAMMRDQNTLMFDGNPLAAKVLTEKAPMNAVIATALEDE